MFTIRRLAFATSGLLFCVGVFAQSTTKPATAPATVPTTTTAPATTTASAISWDQASKHVGETVTVTGPVMGTHELSDGEHVLLNVGKDFPDDSRLTIYLTPAASAPGKASPSADSTYVGKTVSVTGKIELYHDVPEIKATAADVVVQK